MSLSSAAQLADNRRGILCMAGAMACFIINDAFVKFVSRTVPIGQTIFIRSVLVTLIVLAVVRAVDATGRIGEAFEPRVALRGVIDGSATMLYLVSLVHLPLANATAINLAAPLFMTLFAVLFLAEKVGASRWLAILGGFTGVILVIQPRAEGFNIYALVCLSATLLHAVRDLMTRRIASGIPSILITLASALAASVLSGIFVLAQGWQAFGAFEALLMTCSAFFVAGGFYLIIASMRQGEIAVISPFRYSGLIVALILGYFVWGDVPNTLAWCGITLLIGSGIWVLQGERSRHQAATGPG